ncbi:N-acetylneuraminate synthase [Thiorhodococcus drewsii AZ1]|uniref:N-acetylneuraminate synthase n=1 Tax=Thiorhodococcus drewsii AZ1 TaxID=765913 RepID=G2E7F0_9GAMM|nr:N-acetylneuraminate synthase [Thiorhodococcus drewsii]EGV27989.1 N-acetylneuraminate synthase [Thiorhodococcus drewsii AZ1]
MTYVIAEAGVNHNGSLQKALELVASAKESKADAVKFQTFIARDEVSQFAEKAEYQKATTTPTETQLQMIEKLELNREQHLVIQKTCLRFGIDFLSSAFDNGSLDLLRDLNLPRFKIPSGEITNLPYLRHVGAFGKPVILSTGMSTLGDIEAAIETLEAAGTLRSQITVLHCNTEYPTPMADVNLRAMCNIREAFGVAVGYSDHTPGIEIPIAAVALGATVIEKHLTLDRNLPGPDHKASLEPDEFAAMVRAIRNIEQALGDGIKRPSPSEAKNKLIARKSLVATRAIHVGEPFTPDNVTAKRPGTGISPMRWDEVMGRIAGSDYTEDELIEF